MKAVPAIGDLFRIAAYLVNTYGKRLSSDNDDAALAKSMVSAHSAQNELQIFMEQNDMIHRPSKFQQLGPDNLMDFPKQSLLQLKELFTGSYQLKVAASYLAEIFRNGQFLIEYCKTDNRIIKFKINSRHISGKVYHTFVKYSLDKEKPITGYYCKCPNGARTIGCCVHVATVIFYLSYARYQSKIPSPAGFLNKIFEQRSDSALVLPVLEDSDSDCD